MLTGDLDTGEMMTEDKYPSWWGSESNFTVAVDYGCLPIYARIPPST